MFQLNFWIILIPLISAFIGWVTNMIAIKMLFHPREPKKILWFTFHGIFPKRQKAFADKLGKLVSKELISYDEIQEKISNPENLKKIMPMIDEHVENFLRIKLSDEMPFLSLFIGDRSIESMKRIFMQELEILFPQIMHTYTNKLREELDLEKLVTEKVASFSTEKLESIIFQIMKKEFRYVEIMGGVIGFLIGLIQVLITNLAI